MLVNSNEMLLKAKKNHYAVPHFNINNLEWTKYILEECNELNIPVILGVSEGAAKYMGGFNTIYKMTEGLIQDLNIKIPVCLHVDHAKSEKVCIAAIDAGFKSVMIDASIYQVEENILITKKVVDYAHKHNVSVEAEIGHIKEAKDNIEKMENATLEDCLKIVKETHIDSLAPALGSVHGLYKEEANLDFETMQKAGLLLKEIDQNKTEQELSEDSSYIEYTSLISQTVPVNPDMSLLQVINGFIAKIIEFIKSFILTSVK